MIKEKKYRGIWIETISELVGEPNSLARNWWKIQSLMEVAFLWGQRSRSEMEYNHEDLWNFLKKENPELYQFLYFDRVEGKPINQFIKLRFMPQPGEFREEGVE